MGCAWEVPGAQGGKGGCCTGSAKVYECLLRSLWTGFGLLPAAGRPCGQGTERSLLTSWFQKDMQASDKEGWGLINQVAPGKG